MINKSKKKKTSINYFACTLKKEREEKKIAFQIY